MKKQLHKLFSRDVVINVLEKFISKQIDVHQATALLKLGRSRFFDLLKSYRTDPKNFSIEYRRATATNKIDPKIEGRIFKELEHEKKLIQDSSNPIRDYNYSFIKETLEKKHDIQVSLSTIINRAKKMNFTKAEKFIARTTAKS